MPAKDPEYREMMTKVKAILAGFPRDDLEELHGYLGDLLPDDDEVAAIHDDAARRVDDARLAAGQATGTGPTVTRRKEWVRCGKDSCRCTGQPPRLHGPYWYEYWRQDGRLRKRYAGKAES